MTESTPSEDLRAQAREVVDALPAETALGNRDPQGGGQGDPADYVSPLHRAASGDEAAAGEGDGEGTRGD